MPFSTKQARILRRTLLGVAGILTLGALVTAYIDWRGARLWKTRLAQETTAGHDPLQLPRPSTLPESENFLLQPRLAALWFKPENGSVPASNPLQGLPVGLPSGNTWGQDKPNSLEALRVYLNSNHIPFQKDADHKTLLQTLLDAQSAFVPLREEMAREYARRPQSELRRPKPISKESPFDSPIIQFRPARIVYQCLEKECLTALARGEGSLACTDTLLELRLSRGILDTPDNCLVETMVGVAALGSSLNTLNAGTRLHAWNEEQLTLLMNELSQQRPVESLQRSLQHEIVCGVLTLDNLRSGQSLGLCFKLNPDSRWTRMLWMPRGLVDESKALLIEISYENRERLSHVYSPELQDYWLAPLTSEGKLKDYSVLNPCLALVTELVPANEKVMFSTLKRAAERDLALTACALERYRLHHQDYPATLEPLVPDFLPALPRDITSGKPLSYTRESKDDYSLACAGLSEPERPKNKSPNDSPATPNKPRQPWLWPKLPSP